MQTAGRRFGAFRTTPSTLWLLTRPTLSKASASFGGKTAAPAKHGTDGAFARKSRGFMGQQWDTGEVAFDVEFWKEVLRVLKPGGCLLSFGGTRTYHKMASAIDDSGFEVRDQFAWMYGTGQPHNHAIGVEGFEGWRTPGLKGSWEPIAVARKPISEKTVAANVRRWGTGGYNIEACRIPAESTKRTARVRGIMQLQGGNARPSHGTFGTPIETGSDKGRYPTNIYHDGSEDVVSMFPQSAGAKAASRSDRSNKNLAVYGAMPDGPAMEPRGDEGSAARFFYSAKATAEDKAGSGHPTVRPIKLMAYYCRLVTPPGGIVLDPFAGSGTTLVAAQREGFRVVGCEREDVFVEAICRRFGMEIVRMTMLPTRHHMENADMALDGPMLNALFGDLFPRKSSARYARFLGIAQRSVARFLAGEKVWEASDDQIQLFEDQKAALTESGFVGKLNAAVADATAAGVHPEIVAAWLEAAHASLTDRPLE